MSSLQPSPAVVLLPWGVVAILILGATVCFGEPALVAVPGTADPWLAGMPDGTSASDSAPLESPPQVVGISIVPRTALTFRVAGTVTNDFSIGDPHPADGYGSTPHNAGAQNGIGDIVTPFVSLVGVFLGADQPNLTPAPATRLSFDTSASRDYLSLSPGLKQPFFIGDGLTSTGLRQEVVVPDGATRLFLGPMDSTGWSNNGGAFAVEVNVVPEPAAATVCIACFAAFALRRRSQDVVP